MDEYKFPEDCQYTEEDEWVRDEGQQRFLLEKIMGEGWSVRRTEREARVRANAKKRAPRPKQTSLDPYFDLISDQLGQTLGVDVLVKRRGTRGRLEIPFESLSELRTILGQLGIENLSGSA